MMNIDSTGNIIVGISVILIISFIIIFIIIITTMISINSENLNSITDDNFKYIIKDYSNNIEFIAFDSLKEISNNIIISKTPSLNIQNDLKENLNNKLNEKNHEYSLKHDIKIQTEVLSIENGETPEYIKFKVRMSCEKNNEKYNNIVESKLSISGLNDPLPVLICGYESSFSYNETRVLYKNSLSDYLEKQSTNNSQGYINATSPFIVKFCPYDPYIHHGDSNILKNCIENGYYHESSDGSCYLCRLEGKGVCPHYGFETYIIPSSNISTSTSSIDHVIFHDRYPGNAFQYDIGKNLFLDNSHKLKYGLI